MEKLFNLETDYTDIYKNIDKKIFNNQELTKKESRVFLQIIEEIKGKLKYVYKIDYKKDVNGIEKTYVRFYESKSDIENLNPMVIIDNIKDLMITINLIQENNFDFKKINNLKEKMPDFISFSDIKPFTNSGSYNTDIFLEHLERNIRDWVEQGLNFNPDFQREHVWKIKQQINYVEYFLKGGKSGRTIYFNNPSWYDLKDHEYNDFVVVDGKQRLTALLSFVKNEFKVFSKYYYKDFAGFCDKSLKININDLKTKKEVLQWYLELNTAGTPHTQKEIEKVQKLLLELEK